MKILFIVPFMLSLLLLAARAEENTNSLNAPKNWNVFVDAAPPARIPQTEAEEDFSKNFGRKLPAPELLQPALDSELPTYKPVADRELAGRYTAASSDVLPGLVQAWIAKFKKYYPKVQIDLNPPYAGSLGAKELIKEKLDLAFVSRELKPEDITAFKAKFGYDPLSVPISGGSYRHFGFLDTVAFIVNLENPIKQLSFTQLDAIFSKTLVRGGRPIQTWGELGLAGDWADKPIHLYGLKPWNGFEEFIRQRVLSTDGKRGEWRDDINFTKLVFPLARSVANDKYALAYDGMAYLDSGVKVVAVGASPDGSFYAPSYENVARADYPLSRLIYCNMNKNPDKPMDPVIAEFLRFILSAEGQQIVRDQGIFVPLRAKQLPELPLTLVTK